MKCKVTNLREILELVKPYVIITGSYAEGTQTFSSDIDFYIIRKPEEEIDLEADIVEDTYCNHLMKIFKDRDYSLDSCFPDSFNVNKTLIPLEFSSFYQIEEDNVFEIDILGIKMKASKSTYVK